MHVTIVQHYGDYRMLCAPGVTDRAEGYRGQFHLLETVRGLAAECGAASIVVCSGPEKYHVDQPDGVTLVAAGINPYESADELASILSELGTTHLVVQLPCRKIFRLARRCRLPVLPMLADSFADRRWRFRLSVHRLMAELRRPGNYWIGNHGFSSSEALTEFGIEPKRILPWDAPRIVTPPPVRAAGGADVDDVRLVFAGALIESKGVGDAVECVRHLRDLGVKARLDIIGGGETTWLREKADQLGVESYVSFVGHIPNPEVLQRMRIATAVLVPSWSSYGEAMPLTMLEALSVGTPIVVSTHPMFTRLLAHRVSAVIVPEQNPRMMATEVRELVNDADLYDELSRRSSQTLALLAVPGEWRTIILDWLADPSPSNPSLQAVCLASLPLMRSPSG